MAKHDLHNPTGSDVITQKLREERKQKKVGPTKKRQSLISFEVTSEPTRKHAPQKASKSVRTSQEPRPEKMGTGKGVKTAASAPRWKRIAVIAIIVLVLLLVFYFWNNYQKNVYIEDLKSANEEFAQANEEQQSKIDELEQRLGGDDMGS